MSIVRLRRLTGALLLLGILCAALLVVFADSGAFDQPSSFQQQHPDRLLLGFLLFLVWMMVVAVSGISQVTDREYPVWYDIAGLSAWVGLFLAWFGSVYFAFDKVHDFHTSVVVYLFNAVPLVQFAALCVLNPHFEPARALPRRT